MIRSTRLALVALFSSGCAAGTLLGGPLPPPDRCASKAGVEAEACKEWRTKGYDWVKSLARLDELCIEGAVGDTPAVDSRTGCIARAKVEDGGPDEFELRVLEAAPTSKYRERVSSVLPFTGAQLVDAYLVDHGF